MRNDGKVKAGDTLTVRVTPKAAAERVVEDEGVYKVYVTVVPEDGKANKAVLALLAKHLGVAKGRLEIVRGETGRDKVIRLV